MAENSFYRLTFNLAGHSSLPLFRLLYSGVTSEAKNYAKLFFSRRTFFFPQRLSVTCNFRAWLYERIPDVTNLKSIYLVVTSFVDPRFQRISMYRFFGKRGREREITSIANNCHFAGQGSLNVSRACDCHDSLGREIQSFRDKH